MIAVAQEGSSLRVDRFRAHYLIASDHPAPDSVKRRLDETLDKTLPDSLRFALSGSFSDDDDSIWFVRELGINLDLNLGWNSEQLGRAFAAQFVRKLSRDLKEDNAHGIVRFANRAAYLASFLCDLARGHAWSKWYYKSFNGLRMLPLSAAIRTAVCAELHNSIPALRELSSRDLSAVIEALSGQDARRVLSAIADNQPELNETGCFEELWKVWARDSFDHIQGVTEANRALLLFLEVQRGGMVSGPSLKNAALALVRLAVRLGYGSQTRNKNVLRALTSRNIADLYVAAGSSDAQVLMPLTRCSSPLLKEIGKGLSTSSNRSAVEQTDEGISQTPFGGAFLLLPLIDRLPLERWTDGWKPLSQQSAASLFRFLILLKCFGKERFWRAFGDPLLRDLLQIDPRITPVSIIEWQKQIPRTILEAFLGSLRSWEQQNRPPTKEALLLIGARVGRKVIGLLLEAERGHWLFAATYTANSPAPFLKHLLRWLSDNEQPVSVIADACFVTHLREMSESIDVTELDQFSNQACKDESIEATLGSLSRINNDFQYLELPDQLKFSTPFDLTLSIAAQRVLRTLAWSLPGFSRSGLPYLYANFLDFPASVEPEPDRYVVRLSTPPLNIILAVAGLQRSTFNLSWLQDERPFKLFLAD